MLYLRLCNNEATYHSPTNIGYLYVVGEIEAIDRFPLNVDPANQCCQSTLAGMEDAFLTQFTRSGLINIEEYDLKITQLQVFPSPASNYLNIEFNSNNKFDSNPKVYNLLGELSISEKVNILPGKNVFNLSTQKLQNGFYILEITNTKNKCATKFIKYD